jgi:nucleoside-diphosphate-sugar epimerase
MKSILITGGTGHIGSYLIRNLHMFLPDIKIYILDNMSTNRYCSLFSLPKECNYKFLNLDLTTCSLADIPDSDLTIHLAAKTDAAQSAKFKDEFYSNNLNSTKKIIEYINNNNSKILFASSTSVYGSQSNLVDENCNESELNPQSPYADVKLEEEKLIKTVFNKIKKKYLILRLGTIYGFAPGIRFHTAVNKFCYQASIGKPLTIWKTAYEQKRPYLGLSDLNLAICHIVKHNLINNETFNLVSHNMKVREIIEIIKQKLKVTIEFVEHEIMNQLSFEVSNNKFLNTNFKFNSDIKNEISETLDKLRHLKNEM